jgi:glycine cleavage system regulatory protein
MEREVIMTVIGNDRPGLVEALAKVIAEHGGNWLESRMCHLGGEFAGILRVKFSGVEEAAFNEALKELEEAGLTVQVRTQAEPDTGMFSRIPLAVLEIIGQDRPGIVRQISGVLAAAHINVEELHTERTSAPMSGEALFKATIRLRIPPACPPPALRQSLEKLGAAMQIDVQFRASE